MLTESETRREEQQLLEESGKRKEEDYKGMVDTLKEQKQELMNQKDELKLQKEEIAKLVDEKEELFLSVEKEITDKGDKSFTGAPEYIKLKEIISGYKWSLKERQRALEKLALNTENLLENTNQIISTTEVEGSREPCGEKMIWS